MAHLRHAADPWRDHNTLGPVVSYPRDSVIFREGHHIRTIFIIDAGLVSILVTENGRQILGAVRRAGWLLGGAAAICSTNHVATACALSPCELRPLDVEAFHELRRKD